MFGVQRDKSVVRALRVPAIPLPPAAHGNAMRGAFVRIVATLAAIAVRLWLIQSLN